MIHSFACRIGSAFCAGALLSSAASAATRSTWTVNAGTSYSSGDYGDISATKVFALPFSLTYRRGGLKLRIALPWVRISGPGSLIQTPEGRDAGGGPAVGSNSGPGSSNSGGGGPGPSGGGGDVESGDDHGGSGGGSGGGGGSTGSNGRRSGIGDLTLSAVYSVPLGGGFYVEPGAKLKLPTGSQRKRISTGKTDITLFGDVVKEFEDVTIYAGARHRFTGKPAHSDLQSTWGAGGGASFRVSRTFLIGSDYDWQQSSTRGHGPSSELTGWVSMRLTRQTRLTLSATKGFTRNSADYAAAATVSWRI